MVKPTKIKTISITDSSLLESDEEDLDFIGSNSDSDSSSDSENDERIKKKVKLDETLIEPTLSKDDVEDLWASFNTPDEPIASTSNSTTSTINTTTVKPKKIIITTSYEFVGETVIQEKEVLEDSEEAKKWLAQQALKPTSTTSSSVKGKGVAIPSTSTLAEDALFGESSSTSTSTPPIATATTEVASTSTPIPAKIGPPKRAKGGLASLASLSKPPKLNTLEKSKLDWNKFVAKEDLSDDLTKARKDGYLEKQDFLQRTEDRKEEEYDKVKAARGRR